MDLWINQDAWQDQRELEKEEVISNPLSVKELKISIPIFID